MMSRFPHWVTDGSSIGNYHVQFLSLRFVSDVFKLYSCGTNLQNPNKRPIICERNFIGNIKFQVTSFVLLSFTSCSSIKFPLRFFPTSWVRRVKSQWRHKYVTDVTKNKTLVHLSLLLLSYSSQSWTIMFVPVRLRFASVSNESGLCLLVLIWIRGHVRAIILHYYPTSM